jgi:hypothetical protein
VHAVLEYPVPLVVFVCSDSLGLLKSLLEKGLGVRLAPKVQLRLAKQPPAQPLVAVDTGYSEYIRAARHHLI